MISDTPDRAESMPAAAPPAAQESSRIAPSPAAGKNASAAPDVGVVPAANQQPEGSEEFARSTVDALSAHIAILDEQGMILHTNQAWRSFATANGMSDRAFAVGRNYLAICEAAVAANAAEAEDARAAIAGIRGVLRGVNREFTMEYACHSPTEQRWFVMRVTRIDGPGPLRVVMAHEDVTERRLAEEALKASEQNFRVLADNAQDVIFRYDCRPSGHYAYISPAVTTLTGYTPEEWYADPGLTLRVVHPEDRAIVAPMFRGTAPLLPSFVVRFVRKNEETIWVEQRCVAIRDAAGAMLAVEGITRDITERKLGEDALRESEEQLRIAATAADIGMWSWEPGTSHVTVSVNWRRLFGVSDAVVVTFDTWRDALHPDDRERAVAELNAANDQHREFNVEYRVVRPDGTMRWMIDRGRAWYDESGRSLGMAGVNVDITERKHAEEALAAAKANAEQAKEVAEVASKTKDHFLAVLSHELRNPLNPVLATASMLRANPAFDADTREQLEVICRNAELEARLIDDLLDVTRIERGKIELDRRPVELRTIIRRATEVCMPDIDARKLQFSIDLGPAACWVDADASRLQQVFWNLLKNSAKFTPVGGHVSIRCREDGEGAVVVEVQDSGEGIEAEAIGRIFNAFEQAERTITRQFGGLGLGLTISKAMVEMHGGTIEAHSDGKGKGATFTVCLPLLPAGAAVATTAGTCEMLSSTAASRPLRILLVEDHGDTARIMQRILSADGHKVQTAADVATALKLAETQRFDLLLSDLGLPDGSGLDLMRALRERGLKLPGIALSGFGQEQDMRQTREAGFVEHLVKPVSIPRLEDVIARIFQGGTRAAGG